MTAQGRRANCLGEPARMRMVFIATRLVGIATFQERNAASSANWAMSSANLEARTPMKHGSFDGVCSYLTAYTLRQSVHRVTVSTCRGGNQKEEDVRESV